MKYNVTLNQEEIDILKNNDKRVELNNWIILILIFISMAIGFGLGYIVFVGV